MNALTTLSSDRLQAAGLTEQDLPAVTALADALVQGDSQAVLEFGREANKITATLADELLSQVRNADLDRSGKVLSDVVVTAKQLNLGALGANRWRVPVIGPLLDRVMMSKAKLMARFESTASQIDALMGEVEASQQSLRERVVMMESLHARVGEEYRALGMHVAAGELCLQRLQAEQGTGTDVGQDAGAHHRHAALHKRVADLRVLQQAALQTLPMIRVIQANNEMLIDKFNNVRDLTLPAWKRQFLLHLTLDEQQASAQLATRIDDATNELMRRNAELLHQNAVATAKANQRLVIDVDTLESVQKQLVRTIEDVISINKKGIAERRDAEKRILTLRNDMAQLAHQVEPEARPQLN